MSDNTILINGGASRICRGLAEAFHRLDNQVITGRRKALLDEVARANPGMDTVELVITDAAHIQRVAQGLIVKYPALNVVINNAGVMPFDNAANPLDDAQAVKLVATNLLGPVRLTLLPEARPYVTFQHPGIKFLHLLSGRVRYRYGTKTIQLAPGDTLQFDATALHGIDAIEEGPFSYLSVVFTMRE